MNEMKQAIPTRKLNWALLGAFSIAVFGMLFMLYIAINTSVRYGLSWSFDPEENGHIGTFIASVAGTLFALTNAILLYAAFSAQQAANKQNAEQHSEAVQERRFERFVVRVNEIELAIKGFRFKQLTGPDHSFEGLSAWNELFIAWYLASAPWEIRKGLDLNGRIEPDSFFSEQGFVLDLLVQLNEITTESRRLMTMDLDRTYLINKVERLQNQMARFRPKLVDVRALLQGVISDGVEGLPKSEYSSEILYVIDQLGTMINALPTVPYRQRSEHGALKISFSAQRARLDLEADDVPSVQIDTIRFTSSDPNWIVRINDTRFFVQMTCQDDSGREISMQRQPFDMAVLVNKHSTKEPLFDTKGWWRSEGHFNSNFRADQHVHWTIVIDCVGLTFQEGESLELLLLTNASLAAHES